MKVRWVSLLLLLALCVSASASLQLASQEDLRQLHQLAQKLDLNFQLQSPVSWSRDDAALILEQIYSKLALLDLNNKSVLSQADLEMLNTLGQKYKAELQRQGIKIKPNLRRINQEDELSRFQTDFKEYQIIRPGVRFIPFMRSTIEYSQQGNNNDFIVFVTPGYEMEAAPIQDQENYAYARIAFPYNFKNTAPDRILEDSYFLYSNKNLSLQAANISMRYTPLTLGFCERIPEFLPAIFREQQRQQLLVRKLVNGALPMEGITSHYDIVDGLKIGGFFAFDEKQSQFFNISWPDLTDGSKVYYTGIRAERIGKRAEFSTNLVGFKSFIPASTDGSADLSNIVGSFGAQVDLTPGYDLNFEVAYATYILDKLFARNQGSDVYWYRENLKKLQDFGFSATINGKRDQLSGAFSIRHTGPNFKALLAQINVDDSIFTSSYDLEGYGEATPNQQLVKLALVYGLSADATLNLVYATARPILQQELVKGGSKLGIGGSVRLYPAFSSQPLEVRGGYEIQKNGYNAIEQNFILGEAKRFDLGVTYPLNARCKIMGGVSDKVDTFTNSNENTQIVGIGASYQLDFFSTLTLTGIKTKVEHAEPSYVTKLELNRAF